MNLQHVNVKLFVDGPLEIELQRFIEVFHQWIVRDALDEMPIDVADYRHVPQGPGVMLIGLESDYSLDLTHDKPGLLYNRKAPLEGSNADRFLHSLRHALKACDVLEAEVAGLKFCRKGFELLINDRALAPNTEETRKAFEAEVSSFVKDTLGTDDFVLEINNDPRSRVGAQVRLKEPLDSARVLA